MKRVFQKEGVKEYLRQETGTADYRVTPAGKAGSERVFYRITPYAPGIPSAVLVYWGKIDRDWQRYIDISREVCSLSSIIPEVYSYRRDLKLMIVEDCGYETIGDRIRRGESEVRKIYAAAAERLLEWQNMDIDKVPSIRDRRFSQEDFLWESDYFLTYCIRQYLNIALSDDSVWEKDVKRLSEEASSFDYLPVHRDFQSDNIMAFKGIRFVDYQGARMGPGGYDIASLLYDPYAEWMDEPNRNYMIKHFTDKSDISEREICLCGIQRLMQACGAYANLGLNKGKPGFLRFLKPGLRNLSEVLSYVSDYRGIMETVEAAENSLE